MSQHGSTRTSNSDRPVLSSQQYRTVLEQVKICDAPPRAIIASHSAQNQAYHGTHRHPGFGAPRPDFYSQKPSYGNPRLPQYSGMAVPQFSSITIQPSQAQSKPLSSQSTGPITASKPPAPTPPIPASTPPVAKPPIPETKTEVAESSSKIPTPAVSSAPTNVPAAQAPSSNLKTPTSNLKASQVRIGGEIVELLNENVLFNIRRVDKVSEEMLVESKFSFHWLEDGGGKGGSKMQFNKDHNLFIKELSDDDREGLENILKRYSEYVLSHPHSLLIRFYYHFKRSNGQDYVVMNSWMPKGELWDKYDLKGTADDKMLIKDGMKVEQIHKRFYMAHWIASEAFCNSAGVPPERRRYYEGKKLAFAHQIKLKKADHDEIISAVEEDVRFLQGMGLMDYSLLVGTIRAPSAPHGQAPAFPSGSAAAPHQPYVVKDGDQFVAHYFGIIDFLQQWTTGKKAAHVVKLLFAPKPISTVEPIQYGEQFLKANARRFV